MLTGLSQKYCLGKTLAGEPPRTFPYFEVIPEEERSEVNLFATTDLKNQKRIFGIREPDLRRHMYVIGAEQ
jgi:hypothetical protein